MLATLAADREPTGRIRVPRLDIANEIISEIFINLLPPYPECAPCLGLYSPLNLTHICRKWRQIALATPRLWRALLLGPTDVWNDLQGVWVDRSGCCPLSIVVDDGYKEEQDVYRGGEFLEAILPYRDRCEYVQLVTTNLHLPLILGSWPSLRHLDLDLSESDPDGRHHDLGSVPLLRSAALIRPQSFYYVAAPESLRLSGDGELITDTLSYFNLPALSRLEVSEELLDPSPISSLRSLISRSSCKLEHVCIGGLRSVVDEVYRTAFPSTIFTFTTPTADSVTGASGCVGGFWV
ncbi:F-box domain-containing protein [Favolaschia claudopus]|uniref:F-box domain-containing protein n=1 Tax=Favolaschia claudopus TaxID=2862362 RepID=A0AAW0C8P7_9AGAR